MRFHFLNRLGQSVVLIVLLQNIHTHQSDGVCAFRCFFLLKRDVREDDHKMVNHS